jgi:hypothetical protein
MHALRPFYPHIDTECQKDRNEKSEQHHIGTLAIVMGSITETVVACKEDHTAHGDRPSGV